MNPEAISCRGSPLHDATRAEIDVLELEGAERDVGLRAPDPFHPRDEQRVVARLVLRLDGAVEADHRLGEKRNAARRFDGREASEIVLRARSWRVEEILELAASPPDHVQPEASSRSNQPVREVRAVDSRGEQRRLAG